MAGITRNILSQNNSLGLEAKAESCCSLEIHSPGPLPTGIKDLISGPNVLAALTLSLNPAIALCRPSDSGAKFHIPEKEEIFFGDWQFGKESELPDSCLEKWDARGVPVEHTVLHTRTRTENH